MKIEIVKEEKNLVKLNVEIPAKDAIEAYNKAAQKVSQHMNIPGFRKGKAPRAVVEQNVGAERLKYEALEDMLPKIFQKAIQENNLDIISQPEVTSYEFNIGEDVKIVAQVELRPEVKLGEYKGLTVEVEGYKIPEDAFQKSLDSFLERAASFEVVVDRPAIETDHVKFDFDGYSNGEKIQNGDGQNYTLDIANSNFIPGFAEQLVGHSVGEEFEINVTFPESYNEAKLAGQPAVFKIKIHEIKKKVTPELNEEFAKKVGFDSVDALKEDIQKYLDNNKKSKDEKAIEEAIFKKVLADVQVEIQESMIVREEELLLNEYKEKLAAQGYTYEQAIEAQSEEEIFKIINQDAERRIKNSLVIDQLAKEIGLKIETDDMKVKIEEIQSMYGVDRNQFMQQMAQNPNLLNSISQQIISEKVTEFLKENNTVKFV